ncbi:uncharacterized protein LOC134540316 [Bacillus rossius redtenbacheri]|uniref:uncharacterized protein LOC134540316 n=1 Tax=Bacillus rossius redtenbacheri TaxID=93214 RepID=UPI002FDD0B24
MGGYSQRPQPDSRGRSGTGKGLRAEEEGNSQPSITCAKHTACYLCNGYYGPCFEEPICTTCHAFVFPEDLNLSAPAVISKKTDDGDSGNDEPNDYGTEQRQSQQQQQQPPPPPPPPMPACWRPAGSPPPPPRRHNRLAEQVDKLSASPREPDDYGTERQQQTPLVPAYRRQAGSPPRRHNRLTEQILKLSTPREPDRPGSGMIASLPPEVLLVVFSYLDDLSLWSVGNVCRRWNRLLRTHVSAEQWRGYTNNRWPLFRPLCFVRDWFKVYTQLVESCPCKTCLQQMALQQIPAGEENTWRKIRLRNELKVVAGPRSDPPEGIEAVPLDENYCHWQATITGPVGSPYEGGLFFLYIQVPYSYPLSPPVVRFLTRIFHPNVSRHGDVGIDSLHHNWSLALTISKVVISVQSLLTDPYCKVCMEPEVGKLYMEDRCKFNSMARVWTWRYAMIDILQPL